MKAAVSKATVGARNGRGTRIRFLALPHNYELGRKGIGDEGATTAGDRGKGGPSGTNLPEKKYKTQIDPPASVLPKSEIMEKSSEFHTKPILEETGPTNHP